MSRSRPERERRRRSRALAPVAAAAVLAAALTALLLPLGGAAQPDSAPVNTVPPTITGQAIVGSQLTASNGSWDQPIVVFGYQWYRCDQAGASCSPIGGTNAQRYEVRVEDVGRTLRVVVSATNGQGQTGVSPLSARTDVVQPPSGRPRATGEPRISGDFVQGKQLSTTTGTWAGSTPFAFTYQWVRCGADGGRPDGSNCAVIQSATKATYVLAQADVGSRMRVRVTAANSSGQQTIASNATPRIQAGQAAVNTKRPFVTGSMVEGATVTVNRGTWTGTQPITFTYQWLRCDSRGGSCAAIPRATATQYKLTSADIGHKVRVNVTARNSLGSVTVMSTEPATVAPAGPSGIVQLPSGERSIPATSVAAADRLIVSEVRFTPNPIRSRKDPITIRVRVKGTRGFVIRDALVFVRSTPLVTKGESRVRTATDGWAEFTVLPRFNFPKVRRGFNVQFFVKAYRAGDPPLAGVAGYRLVQVRLAR
jgi:hypothetical protein